MDSTDGLQRGVPAVATGAPIMVPVGHSTLGRIFNVLGQPIDEKGEVKAEDVLSHPSLSPALFRAIHPRGNLRDRHQSH